MGAPARRRTRSRRAARGGPPCTRGRATRDQRRDCGMARAPCAMSLELTSQLHAPAHARARLQSGQEGDAGSEEVFSSAQRDRRFEVDGLLALLGGAPVLGPALGLVWVLPDQRVVAGVALQQPVREHGSREMLVVHPGALNELELIFDVCLKAQEEQSSGRVWAVVVWQVVRSARHRWPVGDAAARDATTLLALE